MHREEAWHDRGLECASSCEFLAVDVVDAVLHVHLGKVLPFLCAELCRVFCPRGSEAVVCLRLHAVHTSWKFHILIEVDISTVVHLKEAASLGEGTLSRFELPVVHARRRVRCLVGETKVTPVHLVGNVVTLLPARCVRHLSKGCCHAHKEHRRCK